jgi:hypothetical protein
VAGAKCTPLRVPPSNIRAPRALGIKHPAPQLARAKYTDGDYDVCVPLWQLWHLGGGRGTVAVMAGVYLYGHYGIMVWRLWRLWQLWRGMPLRAGGGKDGLPRHICHCGHKKWCVAELPYTLQFLP